MTDPSRDLEWKRDGADWVLMCRRRRMGRVVPDTEHAGMWRSVMTRGRLSDMANSPGARARSLRLPSATWNMKLGTRLCATVPQCSASGGCRKPICPSIRSSRGPATWVAASDAHDAVLVALTDSVSYRPTTLSEKAEVRLPRKHLPVAPAPSELIRKNF
jgi:hypothetical protein